MSIQTPSSDRDPLLPTHMNHSTSHRLSTPKITFPSSSTNPAFDIPNDRKSQTHTQSILIGRNERMGERQGLPKLSRECLWSYVSTRLPRHRAHGRRPSAMGGADRHRKSQGNQVLRILHFAYVPCLWRFGGWSMFGCCRMEEGLVLVTRATTDCLGWPDLYLHYCQKYVALLFSLLSSLGASWTGDIFQCSRSLCLSQGGEPPFLVHFGRIRGASVVLQCLNRNQAKCECGDTIMLPPVAMASLLTLEDGRLISTHLTGHRCQIAFDGPGEDLKPGGRRR